MNRRATEIDLVPEALVSARAPAAPGSPPAFEVRDLGFRYRGAPRPALEGVSCSVEPGTISGIIGPNGSGKSTLLRLLLGSLEPGIGEVRYEGRPVRGWTRRELARAIGVVPQREEGAFPLTARELVAMGRYPHLRTWQREGTLDRRAIADALYRCEVAHLAERPLETLSGGELQRVRIARALAQQPRTLVLDEPTAALDIRHEMAIFELLAEVAARDGVTVVVVTHNLNLAARYADRLLLLDRGRTARAGAPARVLERATLERVYGWPVVVNAHPGPGPDAGAPQVITLAAPREAPPSTIAPAAASTAAALITDKDTGEP
jgi:iron complex transport system ATP-binding protein